MLLQCLSVQAQSNEWRLMPIRSRQEFAEGRLGGEAEQHPHGIARCLAHPNVIYISHDVTGPWRSSNAGHTWRKTLAAGLYVSHGQSIEVDPLDPDSVFITVDNTYNFLAAGAEGLYRSRDGGESFERVLAVAPNYDSSLHRIHRHNIAYDLSSVTASNAVRWYAAFPDSGLYRSDDGGDTWGGGPVSSLSGHAVIYGVHTHPADGQTVFVASSEGLRVSYVRGAGLQPLGNLPVGAVSSLAIHPMTPSTIYATLHAQGLYRSLDGGSTFSLLRSFDASRVFMNPGHPDVLYLTGVSANTITSHDAGQTWIEDMVTVPAPGLGRSGGWKGRIAGELSGIVPNPRNPNEAVAFSRATLWKTTDGGQTFVDSSTLFSGYACTWGFKAIAFDRFDSDRFATFNCDVGMAITSNRTDYFERRNDQAWNWYSQGLVSWVGAYAGDIQPIPGSDVIVASVGYYFDTQLMRTANAGQTWQLVTTSAHRNFFLSFHPDDPSVVYAGNKISHDAGLTFTPVNFGAYNSLSPEIVGMCSAQANTIYAMDVPAREYLLRSDDRGATWVEYAHPGWAFRRLDSFPTFGADPVDPNKVYTMDSNHDLAIFDGTNWTSTGVLALAGDADVGNFVRYVAVDPNRPEVIYAGTSAAGLPCIFRSTDGGQLWQDITFNLPRIGMNAISVNPHTGELFRGSTVGTWVFPPPYAATNLVYEKLVAYSQLDSTPPSAPVGLTGQAVGDTSIRLDWGEAVDDVGVTGYTIYRDGMEVVRVTVTNYVDTGLNVATSYTYAVSAYDGLENESEPTGSVDVNTGTDEVPPTVLAVTPLSKMLLEVVFDESVSRTSAEKVSCYAIDNGQVVVSAARQEDHTRVHLSTTLHTNGSYHLTLRDVADTRGNLLSETTLGYSCEGTLILMMHLDGDLQDSSGNGLHGGWQDGVGSYVPDGVSRQAVHCDGTDAGPYVRVPNHESLDGMDTLCASVWARKRTIAGGGRLLHKHVAYQIEVHGAGVSAYLFTTEGRHDLSGLNVPGIADTEWHQYVMIYDGTQVWLYADDPGNVVDTTAATGTVAVSQYHGLNIGADPWGDVFDGDIDEVRIAESVLLPSDPDAVGPKGTPWWWLEQYGLTNGSVAALELLDQDGDGMPTWEEREAGTDPTKSESVLELIGAVPYATTQVVVRWSSESNRLYRLRRSTNLLSSGGVDLAVDVPAQPPSNVHTDTVGGLDRAFYRVTVRRE